ncbi:MAG: GNAT family N-acetyltransferase [Proteobacteria bacterium]|nr:GNAT family N-acetyltransferase [Pseudomonadota bacterium]
MNDPGQPIGDEVAGWSGAKRPSRTSMEGQFCRMEPLATERHLADLFAAYSDDTDGRLWTYMTDGPFNSIEELRSWMEPACAADDPLFHALIDLATGKAVGMAAYMRIKPEHGVIEVGSITYAPRLQGTSAATEAMFLMMRRVFNELGYRRYEWKCDALNAPSCRAAERLGFTFDGLFEQAVVYKGRNRDTAWYSILDRNWPPIEQAYVNWLNADNFDEHGQQNRKLQELIAAEQKGFE